MYIHPQFLHVYKLTLPSSAHSGFFPALQSSLLTEIRQNLFLFGDEIFKDSYELKRKLLDN